MKTDPGEGRQERRHVKRHGEYMIQGKRYGFSSDIRDNKILRRSFNELSAQVFGGLTFEPWFQAGYWNEKFCPFVLLDGERVVSNVSVNSISFQYEGKLREYIQLGTVMTAPDYRKRGLSRWLMERILERFRDGCDGVYLFANDSVLDFYPRFGFEKAREYQCVRTLEGGLENARKLDMESAAGRALLWETYAASAPYAKLAFPRNPELLMFYCGGQLRDCVYYLEEKKAVVVAEYKGDIMLCYGVFCEGGASLDELLRSAAKKETLQVQFLFSPWDAREEEIRVYKEEDTTLFLLKGSENLFQRDTLMFPVLSHT